MKEGDIDSFRYFFDHYYHDLCNFACYYLQDQIQSEEIVEELFVWIWVNRDRIVVKKSVKSFLFTVVKLRSLNHIRNEQIHRRIELEVFGRGPDAVPNDGEMMVDGDLIRNLVESAVQRLPKRCREIYLLSKQEEFSNKEIALQLGVSVKTVESQITIASKKVREQLARIQDKIFIFV